MSDTPFPQDSTADGLRKCLNAHGHGFHFRTLERCINVEAIVPWKYAIAEYPVTLRGNDIHIDFVLGSGTHLLVAECKRTEGWTWGFARSWHRTASPRPTADFMEWKSSQLIRRVKQFGPLDVPYDVAVEMKQPNCTASDSRSAFNDALKQVVRGRSGIVDELGRAGELRYGGGAVVPVIFTTAPLIVTDTALSMADHTGHISELATTKRSWLWFDHNISRSLRPEMPHAELPMSPTPPNKTQLLGAGLTRDSKRSVAIVNEEAIDDFLAALRVCLEATTDVMF